MYKLQRLKRMISLSKKGNRFNPSKAKDNPFEPWIQVSIVVTLAACIVLMLPSEKAMQFADFKEGSISPRRIIAPFSFEILKTQQEYQADREQAKNTIKPVFTRNQQISESSLGELEQFFSQVRKYRQFIKKNPRLFSTLQDTLKKHFNMGALDSRTWELLLDASSRITDDELNTLAGSVQRVLRDLYAVGILDQEKNRLTVPDRHIIIDEVREEVIHPLDDFLDLKEARQLSIERMNNAFPRNSKLAQVGFNLLNLILQPNCILDENVYNQRIEEAVSRVPISRGFVIEQEKIVDKNERITPEIRQKLVSLSAKMTEMGMQQGGLKVILPYFGKICFVVAFLFLLSVYIFLKDKSILQKTKSLFLLALVILLVTGSTFLISKVIQKEDLPDPFITTAIGAMLLAMIFDEKIGFAGSAILSVLVGAILGNDFNVMVISFFTGIVGIIVIKRLRNRSQLLQAMLAMIGAYIFILSTSGFIRYASWEELWHQVKIGIILGSVTPILTYLILAILEKIFDITTDYRLLELSNLSHDLMKRLSVEAVGTYHHVIQVGNLADAAARAVGANSLLARVGSYYHDIGKLEKSEYFIENQLEGENPHQKLTPRMSALILSNHVKKGLELADRYGLPSSIKDIMIQHHGTTVMSFFYQKALTKKNADDVNENDYKYTGPKPQTKEAAIVMLADTIEAATRTLKDPTHSRLNGLVDELVDERFQEGELDESPLTLRDLMRIKEAFVKILAGIFHTRIEYPDRDENKEVSEQEPESDAS
jgi:putative nucleotidyltransferase with HDIG domain